MIIYYEPIANQMPITIYPMNDIRLSGNANNPYYETVAYYYEYEIEKDDYKKHILVRWRVSPNALNEPNITNFVNWKCPYYIQELD